MHSSTILIDSIQFTFAIRFAVSRFFPFFYFFFFSFYFISSVLHTDSHTQWPARDPSIGSFRCSISVFPRRNRGLAPQRARNEGGENKSSAEENQKEKKIKSKKEGSQTEKRGRGGKNRKK